MMGLEEREGEGEWGEREGRYLDIWHSCDRVPVFHSSPPILPSAFFLEPGRAEGLR